MEMRKVISIADPNDCHRACRGAHRMKLVTTLEDLGLSRATASRIPKVEKEAKRELLLAGLSEDEIAKVIASTQPLEEYRKIRSIYISRESIK